VKECGLATMPADLIEAIFSLDPDIRFASIVDNEGNQLKGGMRSGKVSLSPKDEESRVFMQHILSRGMSETWTKYRGELRFSIIGYDKIRIFQFPFGENILLVTAEPHVSLDKVEKIVKLLEKEKH
jgi:hypothetical protein